MIAAITFILLVRTFRSILLPIKAVLLNLVSLAEPSPLARADADPEPARELVGRPS